LTGNTLEKKELIVFTFVFCIFFNSVSLCEGLQQAVGAGAAGEAAGGTDGGQLPPLTEGAHASGTKEYR
jgi:hypothetical protein